MSRRSLFVARTGRRAAAAAALAVTLGLWVLMGVVLALWASA